MTTLEHVFIWLCILELMLTGLLNSLAIRRLSRRVNALADLMP